MCTPRFRPLTTSVTADADGQQVAIRVGRAFRHRLRRAAAPRDPHDGESERLEPCDKRRAIRAGCGEHRVGPKVRATVHDRESRPERTQEEPDVRGLATRARREEASVSEVASERKTLDPAAKHRPAQLHERRVDYVANDAEGTGET